MTAILRSVAFLAAIVAILDPPLTIERYAPTPVEVRSAATNPGSASDVHAVEQVRTRLVGALGAGVDLAPFSRPTALVLVGDRLDVNAVPDGQSISTVLTDAGSPEVSVSRFTSSGPLRPGWATTFVAGIEARGMVGKRTRLVLEQNGVELAAVEHAWTREVETFEAALPYIPPAAGVRTVRAVARPLPAELTERDNDLESTVTVDERPLRILVHEPRPSWSTAFVRRALEADPNFRVSSLARVSKGVEFRAGDAPPAVAPEALETFDAVVIGAPEELQRREVDALESFARRRGGTVVLVPDRRPSGIYAGLLRTRAFEEVLIQNAYPIASDPGLSLRGSEFVVAAGLAPGVESLASIEHTGTTRPVVIAWPLGEGRLIFSGVLDSWRYRGGDDSFARFWRGHIGAGAAASPRRLELRFDRGIVSPGDEVVVRARLRGTEFDDRASPVALPKVAGRLTDSRGAEQAIRLWPGLEIGSFEARFDAPEAGRYDVEVRTSTGIVADAVLIVSETRNHARALEPLRTVAAATGGVSVPATDLRPLEKHLASLPHASESRRVHPARSPWWMIGFVALACSEWVARRRKGLR